MVKPSLGRTKARRMLVWDDFAAHKTPRTRRMAHDLYSTDCVIIPGGCTSKLQPCDVSWNRPFKSNFRRYYDEWVIHGPFEYTRGGNRRPHSKYLLLA